MEDEYCNHHGFLKKIKVLAAANIEENATWRKEKWRTNFKDIEGTGRPAFTR